MQGRLKRVAVAIGLAVIQTGGVGCGGDPPDSLPGSERMGPGTPLEINPRPHVTVGVVAGDPREEFDDVVTPFLVPSGLLVVPSTGHGEIRLFDETGDFVRSFGGIGEGPGEFRRIGGAWPRGDTIEVLDLALNRITRLPPTGRPELIRLEGAPAMWGVGILSGGWAVADLVEPGLTRGNPRDQWMIRSFDSSGNHLASMGPFEGIRRIMMAGTFASHPFSPSARFAVHDDEIYVGETLTPEVQVLDAAGRLVRTIELESGSPVDPTDALARVRAGLRGTPPGTQVAQRLADAPMTEEIPVFTDVLVDPEGFLWVRPYVPERDATVLGGTPSVHRNNAGGEWEIYSQEGARVSSVLMPSDLAPYQITSEAVVGVARDQFGVERVRVHSIVRR